MPEQLTLEQFSGDRATVHRDEWASPPRAAVMNGASNDFLTRAGLTENQDARVVAGHLPQQMNDFPDGGRFARRQPRPAVGLARAARAVYRYSDFGNLRDLTRRQCNDLRFDREILSSDASARCDNTQQCAVHEPRRSHTLLPFRVATRFQENPLFSGFFLSPAVQR